MNDSQRVAFVQWALPRLGVRWAGFRKVCHQVCNRARQRTSATARRRASPPARQRASALGLPDLAGCGAYLETYPEEWAPLDQLAEVGNEVGLCSYLNNYAKLPGLPAESKADAADESRANVFGGATIEELAGKIGVDPAVLIADVDEYNGYCHAGADRKFHKPSRYLIPVEEAPFYAVKMETGIMISMGAMKVDDHWRAIGKDDKPIPGLYVVGCDAEGLWGESSTPRPRTRLEMTTPSSASLVDFDVIVVGAGSQVASPHAGWPEPDTTSWSSSGAHNRAPRTCRVGSCIAA